GRLRAQGNGPCRAARDPDADAPAQATRLASLPCRWLALRRRRFRQRRAADALTASLQDLAQLDRKFRGIALEAAMRPGEDDRVRPEPLGQPQSTLMGQLAARFVADRRADAGRAGLQGTEVGLGGGRGEE